MLPRTWALAIGSVLGSLSCLLVKKERLKTEAHLKQVYGDQKTDVEIQKIARGVFVNMALSAVDWILYPRFSKDNWKKLVYWTDEVDRVQKILDQGKGAILVTGHFGNWEMLAATFSILGYEGAVVGRRIYYEPYNSLIVNTRLSKGVKTFYRDDSPRPLLRLLKNNQILGIVADQDVNTIEGIFVPFLGKLAYTPDSPARLSLATGAPIVPAFMVRDGKHYRLKVEEPIYPNKDADRTEEIDRITRLWNDQIAAYVLKYPEQWAWMHRRWKTRPESEASEIATTHL